MRPQQRLARAERALPDSIEDDIVRVSCSRVKSPAV